MRTLKEMRHVGKILVAHSFRRGNMLIVRVWNNQRELFCFRKKKNPYYPHEPKIAISINLQLFLCMTNREAKLIVTMAMYIYLTNIGP